MKMMELIRYGVPEELIGLWRERESDHLLPLQEAAVKRHGLLDGGNLLIQAPTSSGKTFVGEMAAIHTALQGKKVIYLVPLKALAEEKYRDFQEKYAPYGLKVIVCSRDHRAFDQVLEEGKFSIAVVVYEKLSQLLVRRPERMKQVALVLADELEVLSDPERGAALEVLLTRVLQSEARLIGLSAVIGGAEKLAAWMKAALVSHNQRPVELRYGVLFEGSFRYRTFNGCGEGEERLAEGEAYDGSSPSSWDVVMANVRHFLGQGEPCLIFVKDKYKSRRGAELLAEYLSGWPEIAGAASACQEALAEGERTRSQEGLLRTLNAGVAFHNADLSPEERRIVEEGFREGAIRAVVSTSTLAVGLNLPAQNVFIGEDKWCYDKRFGLPWKTPILRSEYVNMSGRAGRFGVGDQPGFGRSILVAQTYFDCETFWRRYIEGECEEIDPRLAHERLEDYVLPLVASNFCRNEEEVQAFLEETLTGQWVWQESLTLEEVEFRVRAAVNRGLDTGMLEKGMDGALAATPLGRAVAAKGISLDTAQALEHWVRESEARTWEDIDLLAAAAMTPDGRLLQVSLTSREYDSGVHVERLKELTRDQDIFADVPLNRIRNCNLMPFFEEVRAIKAALILDEWMEEMPLYELEEAYETMAGQILAAADQVSWLIDAAAALATALGARAAFVERVQRLGERVQRGVREEGLALARVPSLELSRTAISALVAQGLGSPEALMGASVDALGCWVTAGQARRLKEWAAKACGSASGDEVCPGGQSGVPVLVVDDKHPGEILLDRARIRLQEKQYRLIRVLAGHPGECVPYERIYTAVWGETIVEPNQMHFQKRKLLDQIKASLPQREKIITTVPKRGFVLHLEPEQVVLRPLDEVHAA